MRSTNRGEVGQMDVIERYLADLDGALIGPKRLKADMLAEAHEGAQDRRVDRCCSAADRVSSS